MTERAKQITAEYLMRPIEERTANDPFVKWLNGESPDKPKRLAVRYGSEPLPTFLNSPRHPDGPEYVSILEFIAGAAVVVVLCGLIFWGL